MAKPEWGVKRTCPSCGARFYDLTRNPAVCPKCGHEFDPATALKPKRAKGEKPAKAAPAAEPEAEVIEEAGTETGEPAAESVEETGDTADPVAASEEDDEEELGDFSSADPLLADDDPDEDDLDDIGAVRPDDDDGAT